VIRRVAVLGLGLIGGSLGRRLARSCDVVGYDLDPATRDAAGAAGLPVAGSVAAAVAERDLVVVATPLPALGPVLAEVAATGTAAIVTDVVSVKGPALAAARAALQGGPRSGGPRYVGGHPMAGTERSGFGASDPHLFDGAAWVLCLEEDTDLAAWLAVAELVAGLGCRVVPCSAARHDAAVAVVSGLPHLLADALAVAGAESGPLALALAAGSFRDCTRVAGTPPDLVTALCDGNRPALADAASTTIVRLAAAADALRSGGTVAGLAAAGHAARRRFVALSVGGARWSLHSSDPALREQLAALGTAGGHLAGVSGGLLDCWAPAAPAGGEPGGMGPGGAGSARTGSAGGGAGTSQP
jgi:prephenate dehydrogenase